MKAFSRQYNDLDSFQKCPIIFNKFNSHQIVSDLKLTQLSMIKSLIAQEMKLGYYPDVRTMNTIWDKTIEPLRNTHTKEQCNNIFMRVKAFYNSFHDKFYKAGYRPIGVDFPIEYVHHSSVYTAIIPILLGNLDKQIVPLYMSESSTRNNEIRFNTSILNDRLGERVSNIYNINSSSLNISQYNITIDELSRSLSQLGQLLELMEHEYTVPNTTHCKHCSFIQYCRL